ncbi:MAG: hypothetical protein LCH61_13810, partial [Proteobacteria bacterium]|nr:hypothetical protein [Pseudomonadota bacterium]
YVAPVGFGGIRPYVEGGAWHLPDADYKFRRIYANGAGTAVGVGKTSGQQTYAYGRVGAVIGSHETTEWTLAGEIGRMTTRIGAYAEGVSSDNPFDATFARSTDTMTVGKMRLAVTHRFTPVVDTTLWVAGAKAFDQNIGMVAAVVGFGAIRPAVTRAKWVEYGARLGAKVTTNLRVDAFLNGVAAPDSHKVHVGAGLNYQF